MVYTHEMQDSRAKVMDVDRLLDGLEPEIVGSPVDIATLNPPPASHIEKAKD